MENEEIKKIFETDEEGRFVNLVIPEFDGMPEINLTGKKKLELTATEVARYKIYARSLKKAGGI